MIRHETVGRGDLMVLAGVRIQHHQNLRSCIFYCLLCLVAAGCSGGSSPGGLDQASSSDLEIIADDPGPQPPGCPEGSEEIGGWCRFPCPDGWERNQENTCLPPCPVGWIVTDQGCAPPCPNGMEMVGILCRPPADSVGPGPDPGAAYDKTGSEASDEVLHVALWGSAQGPGTVEAPFTQVYQALAHVGPGTADLSVVLHEGTYPLSGDLDSLLPSAKEVEVLRLLGVHADRTVLDLSATGSLSVADSSLTVVFSRVRISDGSIEIAAVHRLEIHRCHLPPAAGADGIDWANITPGGTLVLRDSRVEGRRIGVEVRENSQVAQAEIVGNVFEDCENSSISVFSDGDVTIERNWVLGGGEASAINIDPNAPDGGKELRLERNWFDEVRYGISLSRAAGPHLHLIDNSLRSTEQTPIHIYMVQLATLQGTRIWKASFDESGVNLDGIQVFFCDGVSIEGGVVSGVGENGIEVTTSSSVSILDGMVTRCGKAGIGAEDANKLTICGGTVTNTGSSVDIKGGDVEIQDLIVAANDTYGIRIREASALKVRDSVVVGNGSVGLLASALQGDAETSNVVNGNRVQENVGVGILVRSGGPGTVDMVDNTILGTGPGTVKNVEGQFLVGDGMAILTGTDGVESHATLGENTVRGNMRLGVIAHGTETVLVSSGQDVVLAQNGWLDPLCLGGGGDPRICFGDLNAGSVEQPNVILFQAGAAVEGGAWAVEPADDVTGLVALGGGGDPR